MYQEITFTQFQDHMTTLGYHQVYLEYCFEVVFEKQVQFQEKQFTIRVYSSVSTQTLKTRECGEDAIRVIILDSNLRKVRGDKRVNRVSTWKENLQKRLDTWDKMLDICPQCGYPLADRNGKYGSFIGCSNYPNCGFTTKNKKDSKTAY